MKFSLTTTLLVVALVLLVAQMALDAVTAATGGR